MQAPEEETAGAEMTSAVVSHMSWSLLGEGKPPAGGTNVISTSTLIASGNAQVAETFKCLG